MECGFRITVYRSSLPYLPRVLEWARANLPKVRHVALVAYRAVPIADAWGYQVGGRTVDASDLPQATTDPDRLTVTSERMYEELQQHDWRFQAAAYLPGTAAPHTTKFLVAVQLGARSRLLGYLGPRALEAAQTAHHFLKGRYADFPRSAPVGRKALLLAAVDPAARAAFKGFLGAAVRDPRRLFDPVWTQTISIQQPLEFVDATANECSGCPELTVWQGGLIPSCRLDEYRWFGGPMVPVRGARARVGVG